MTAFDLRRALAAVAGLLAALLLPLSIASTWVAAVVSDTDRYVDVVGPAADDPAVQRAVIDALAQKAATMVDLGVRSPALVRFLTEHGFGALARSGGAVTATLQEAVGESIHQAVRAAVTGPQFASAWRAANRAAHAELVAVLEGHDGAVVDRDGRVTIQLGPVLHTALAGLQRQGLVPPGALPEVRTSLALVRSEDLRHARRGYRLLDAAGFWLPVAWLVAFALLLTLSRRRVRVTRRVLVGSLLGLLVLLLGVAWLRGEVVDRAPEADLTAALWDRLTLGLRTALSVGSLLAAAAFTWLSTLLPNRIGVPPGRAAVLTGRVTATSLVVLAALMIAVL